MLKFKLCSACMGRTMVEVRGLFGDVRCLGDQPKFGRRSNFHLCWFVLFKVWYIWVRSTANRNGETDTGSLQHRKEANYCDILLEESQTETST